MGEVGCGVGKGVEGVVGGLVGRRVVEMGGGGEEVLVGMNRGRKEEGIHSRECFNGRNGGEGAQAMMSII